MANYDLGTAERGEAEAKMETEKQPKDPATSRTISMDEFTEVMTILHGLTKKCYQQLSSEADLDDSKGQCASPGDDFAASSTILDAQLAKYDPHPNAADYGIDVSLRSFNNAVEGHVLVLRNLKLIGQKMARGEQIDKAALALLCCYRGMLVVLLSVIPAVLLRDIREAFELVECAQSRLKALKKALAYTQKRLSWNTLCFTLYALFNFIGIIWYWYICRPLLETCK